MWEFRGTVGLGPLLSQAGGLRARAEEGEWMGPEKQSPHLSGRPWTISMRLPGRDFAGSLTSSVPAQGSRSVVNEEGTFSER